MRLLRSTDAVALVALQTICLPDDKPITLAEGGTWWCANDMTAFCATKPSVRSPKTYYLSRAGVAPSARGQGIQKRMIRLREEYARKQGAEFMITDCTSDNLASANSLISAGYKLYRPAYRWALPNSLYWKKAL